MSRLPLPPPGKSWQDVAAGLPEKEQQKLFAALKNGEVLALADDWQFLGRREQLRPEGDWAVWVILAGRGFGKTRGGSEDIIESHFNRDLYNSALVGPTSLDVRRFMLYGESGIMSVAPKWFYPHHDKVNLKLIWPNGTESHIYTAEKPERMRGPNHDGAWCDELAAWRYLEETWENLEMTLRKSEVPRTVITTTPKPRALLREILKDKETVVTGGSTYANKANLSGRFLARITRRHEGTRIGRQEIYAELLDEVEGALWKRKRLDELRVKPSDVPDMRQVAVGLDPPGTKNENSAEAGIVVCGIDARDHTYTLADISDRMSPNEWGKAAINAYYTWEADCIVAESNFGGDMVRNTIHTLDPNVPVVVVHTMRGKFIRAQPVAALAEQGRDHHAGSFSALEDQLCNFVPDGKEPSPDRLDAKVWAMTYLLKSVGSDFDTSDFVTGDKPKVTTGGYDIP